MLRLWPEVISVGLFPGQCWWQHGKNVVATSQSLAKPAEPAALLTALEAMLDEQGSTLRKRGRVSLLASDSAGAVVALPWQDQLNRYDELDGYARAYFEQQGLEIDERWVLHTEFLHHRARGMAYAFPRVWMEDLLARLNERGLNLQRVLPVSVAAYWCQPRPAKAGSGLTLLSEAGRTCALIYSAQGFVAMDVEPVTSDPKKSISRLLHRVSVHHDRIETVWLWTPAQTTDAALKTHVLACLPDANVHAVQRDAWN